MEIKEIIAKNIAELRKAKKWTQMELAEKLHFTDKAVSKWERAESTPDVDALYELSKLFDVTVDYFFHEQKDAKAKFVLRETINWFKKMMWLFIIDASFVLAALIMFIVGYYLKWPNMWVAFIWATPLISIFTFIFFVRIKNWLGSIISCSLIPWFILLGIYFQLMFFPPFVNVWLIFFVGIPVSGAIVLGYFIDFNKKRRKKLEETL